MTHFKRSELPAHLPEDVKDHYERDAMRGENSANEITEFFGTLNADQLNAVESIMKTILVHGKQAAAQYIGWCDALLVYKFNRCGICGQDHTEELLGGIDPHGTVPDPTEPPDPQPTPGPPAPEPQPDPGSKAPHILHMEQLPKDDDLDWDFKYPEGIAPFLSTRETTIMAEYHLDDAWSSLSDDSIRFIGFACTGVTGNPCGTIYPSIEDRMRRDPDDCSACHQQQKWG